MAASRYVSSEVSRYAWIRAIPWLAAIALLPQIKSLSEVPITTWYSELIISFFKFSARFNKISLAELSKLLYYTNGITARLDYIEWRTGRQLRQFLRATPSGEALFPVELYVGVVNVTGLTPGIYHYNVREHALSLLSSDECFLSAFPEAYTASGETSGTSRGLFQQWTI